MPIMVLTRESARLTLPGTGLSQWLQRRISMFDAAQPTLPFSDQRPSLLAPRAAKKRSAPYPVLDQPASPTQMRAMRQAFLGLVERWALSGQETLKLLGEPSEDAPAREARQTALLGVGRSLLIVLPEGDHCLCYLRRPCPAFAGVSVLQIMLAEGLAGIERVRDFLAGEAQKACPSIGR